MAVLVMVFGVLKVSAQSVTTTATPDSRLPFSEFIADMPNMLIPRQIPLPQLFRGTYEQFDNIRYNRVDGFFAGIGNERATTILRTPHIRAGGAIGYGFGSERAQGIGVIEWVVDREGKPMVIALQGSATTQTPDSWKIGSAENSIFAFLAGQDYRNYYRVAGWRLQVRRGLFDDVTIGVAFERNRYSPLARNVEWSAFGDVENFGENPDFQTGYASLGALSLSYSSESARLGLRSGLRAAAYLEIGRGDFDFEQALFEAEWLGGGSVVSLGIQARLATISGAFPAPMMYSVGGPGAAPGYPPGEARGNRLATLSADMFIHPFQPSFQNAVSGLSLIFMTDIARTANAAAHASVFTDALSLKPEQWLLSYGAAIGSRQGQWRIGAAWRTDRAAPPRLVLRLAP